MWCCQLVPEEIMFLPSGGRKFPIRNFHPLVIFLPSCFFSKRNLRNFFLGFGWGFSLSEIAKYSSLIISRSVFGTGILPAGTSIFGRLRFRMGNKAWKNLVS